MTCAHSQVLFSQFKYVFLEFLLPIFAQVVTPLQGDIMKVFDPEVIAPECNAKGLITSEDLTRILSMTGSDNSRNIELLRQLKKTGKEGYDAFKGILKKWEIPHGYAQLLKRILTKEREVLRKLKGDF